MFRRSPSRNPKSKGFKVKHALQICLLVAICGWLLYQVKHSHDKKKAFDESNAKISEKVESGLDILKFGRKDLHPRVDETASEIEGHSEEEEIEEDVDNKPDNEEEEIKPEENEDEGRGGGDDEIDEQDQEKADEEAERGEDFIDEEEKEREEIESDEQESRINNAGSLEDQDHEGSDRNTQEAREQHYKGDDASSAVVRDTQIISTENEDGGSGNSNEEEQTENIEKNKLEQENKTNSTEEVTTDQNDSGTKVEDGETVKGIPSVNATVSEETGTDVTLSESEVGSHPNSTIDNVSSDHSEAYNNSATENGTTFSLFLQNGTGITSDLTKDQNATLESETSNGDDSNLQTVSLEQTEKSGMSIGSTDSSSNFESDVLEQTIKSNVTAEVEDNSASSTTNENADTVQSDKSDTAAGTEEEAVNENTIAVQSEPVDTSIPQEEKDARTDLETLPETGIEGKSIEDVAAE